LESDSPATLGIECADDEGAWVLTIGPDGVKTTAGSTSDSGPPDCIVRGAAGDLYLALWNRGSDQRLQVSGDRAVLDLFGDAVHVRWS
jgi:hypothetical protein